MKKFLNIVGIIFSIFLTIFMFALEFLLVINLILNEFVAKDNLGEIVEQLMTYNNESSEVLLTFDSASVGLSNYDNNFNYSTLEGKIKDYLTDAGFTNDEAKEIVQDEEFKKIVNNYLESVVLNEIKDSEIKYPTKEEIKKFIKKNYNKFSKVKVIQEKYHKDNIEKFVEENYDDFKEKLDEATEKVKIPEVKEIEYLKKIININPFLIVGFLLITIILMIVSRMSFYKWLMWSSIPTLLNGVLFSAFGLFGMNLIESLVNLDKYADILDPIAKKMSTMMIRYGIILSIITIIMIVAYSVIKNNFKKNIKTKKA